MKKKLTKQQAIAKLQNTRQLSTDLLQPLNISFELFLRFAQLSKKQEQDIIEKLIKKFVTPNL